MMLRKEAVSLRCDSNYLKSCQLSLQSQTSSSMFSQIVERNDNVNLCKMADLEESNWKILSLFLHLAVTNNLGNPDLKQFCEKVRKKGL